MNEPLERLLAGQAVWRCREAGESRADSTTIATGYAALDAYLPGGGWPRHCLLEVISADCGIGELRLLMPALAALAAEQDGYVVWVAPPYRPYAPALTQWGLDVARVLLIQPASAGDALWATEQAVNSGNALAVLGWLPRMDVRMSRRLQLAAVNTRCWVIAFRPASARSESSAAALRLMLSSGSTGSEVDFFKIRGVRPRRICNYDEFRGHWPQLDSAAAIPRTGLSAPG